MIWTGFSCYHWTNFNHQFLGHTAERLVTRALASGWLNRLRTGLERFRFSRHNWDMAATLPTACQGIKGAVLATTLIVWSGFNPHPGHVAAPLNKALNLRWLSLWYSQLNYFHGNNDYFVVGGLLRGWRNPHLLWSFLCPMFLWNFSNPCPLSLRLVRSHQAKILIVKRLIQGRNRVTKVHDVGSTRTPGHVVASLDKTFYDDYLCLVASKQAANSVDKNSKLFTQTLNHWKLLRKCEFLQPRCSQCNEKCKDRPIFSVWRCLVTGG